MTTLNLDNAIELIKNATNKETIEKITKSTLKMMNDRLNANGKNKGLQISEKTFNNDKTDFIAKIKLIENIPDELKSEYKGHLNHHAISIAYEFKYHVVKTEELKTTEETKPKTPKKAVTLDAQKLIDLAISWLDSDDAYLIGISVAILTGRRQSEIFFYSSFTADEENTMIVKYLAKKRDKYNTEFRIPVLCNSDLIESAVEKIRKLLPMSELMEIINNSKDIGKGLEIAREKFNNNYSSQILKIYNNEARQYFADCEDSENKNDKDYFHGIRATYASIFYHLSQEKYQCSVHDSINYVKHCLSHDTDGIAQKYTEFRFKNLPSVESFDDSIFSIENICELANEDKEDIEIKLNFTELLTRLDINSQTELMKKINNGEKLETIFALFINKASQVMMISQAVGNDSKKLDSRDKIGNLVLAMLQHNFNQELIENENDRIYVAINSSSVNLFSKEITGKAIDKSTCIYTVKKLQDKIDDCNENLNLNKKLFGRKNHITGEIEISNLHLRNKAKMELAVKSILEIYEKQSSM